MAPRMKESLKIILWKEMVFILGLMVKNMKANGKITEWMEVVFLVRMARQYIMVNF